MSSSILSRVNRVIVPALLACATLSSAAWAAEGAPAAGGEAQPAVWTEKEFTYVYQGFTSHYSCDGLQDKIRGVLLDLGAQKKSLKVAQLGCSTSIGRPDPFPSVRVKMRVLQPASGADDKEKPVAAHWKPVDLKLRNALPNDSGECELVEQIRQKIVPLFANRNVELRTDCVPHQATAWQPSLKLEVLAPDDAQHSAAEPPAAR
jgi:hypothetical protein